jgi:uncharacterized protein DUF2154
MMPGSLRYCSIIAHSRRFLRAKTNFRNIGLPVSVEVFMPVRIAPFLFLLAGLALAACGLPRDTHNGPVRHSSEAVELDKSEMTRAELHMGAGELKVSGGAAKLLEADFTYDDIADKPLVKHSVSSFRSQVSIEQPGGMRNRSNREYKWDVRLNDAQPLDFSTHLGAGNAEMALGSLTLRSVEVHMGVGNLEMDLRGAPKRDYNVEIHGGVGNAEIRLPKDVGVEARAKGGIGNIDVRGLEKRGATWVNPGHENAPVTIHLDISGGVGNIDLRTQ